MSEKAPPFIILKDYARRARALSAGLPAQEEVVELWSGIGFMLAGQRYVAPMGEVSEILHVPRFTQIPGVKPWMMGASNVRGRLLPIMDLSVYLDTPRASRTNRDRRVLTVEREDIFSGLIVDSVLGMQYFAAGTYEPDVEGLPAPIAPYVMGEYTKNNEKWHVFSTYALTEDTRFLEVSAW